MHSLCVAFGAIKILSIQGKKHPILEIPAHTDKMNIKGMAASSLFFFLVRRAHPQQQLPQQLRYPQAQVLTGDRLQRVNWADWWWQPAVLGFPKVSQCSASVLWAHCMCVMMPQENQHLNGGFLWVLSRS